MSENEKYYFETYKQCKEVTESECYIGGRNCGTCAHCRKWDAKSHEFINNYCLCVRRES